MGRGRRLAAGASLLASAGGFVWLSLQSAPDWIAWRGLAFAAGLAAASYGVTRKNIFGQILSRGLAWVLFAPCAIVGIMELLKARLNEPAVTMFGLASGLALLLARPMLNTDEARDAFAPTKFRRSFLAVCTAAVATGIVTGIVGWEMLWSSEVMSGLALGALGTSMLASAFGVLRMRGWGIVLATLNAILSLVVGAFVGHSEGFVLAATALPSLLFVMPIVYAKLDVGESSATTHTRIADEEALPARVRIDASFKESELRDDELDAQTQTQEPRKTMEVPELTRGISFT